MNNKGMSLAGVLAATGILSIIIMGVMTVANNMMQTARTADIKADVQSEVFLAQALLSTESNCTVNFKGLSIDSKNKNFTANGGKLFLSTKPGVYTLGKSPIFASQNSKTSNVALKSIDYKLYPDSQNVMILSLEFKPRGNILGGSIRDREIPLKVSIVNNKIESCVAMGTPLTDVDDDDPSSGGQGKGCSQPPPKGEEPSNSLYGDLTVDKTSLKEAAEEICEMQKYPVTGGLKIPRKSLEDCAFKGYSYADGYSSMNDRCRALISLATSEGEGWGAFKFRGYFISTRFTDYGKKFFDNGRTLKTRSGYKSKADCLKQQLFSEGDSFAGKTCINGRWTRGSSGGTFIPYEPSGPGGHDHNSISD